MRTLRIAFAVILACLVPLAASAQSWTVQASGMDTDLRGVGAAYFTDAQGVVKPVVWACGSNGVILRSTDEGKTWKRLRVSGGDKLNFRGIVAFDADLAFVMAIGNGDKSRIYKTTDGGATWQLEFTGPRKETFLDAIACYTKVHCFALGDPIDGKFLFLETTDGEEWRDVPRDAMPDALPKEGAFAASNTSLSVHGQDLYFGTGAAARARVFRSADFGRTWSVTETPIAAGNDSSGIFSLDAHWAPMLLAVGGDYSEPALHGRAAALSRDDGKTWELAQQQPGGFRSAVSVINDAIAVAVGPNGIDVTTDRGATWRHADSSLNLNAVTILDLKNGWAVGPKGTIARFPGVEKYLVRATHSDGEATPAAMP